MCEKSPRKKCLNTESFEKTHPLHINRNPAPQNVPTKSHPFPTEIRFLGGEKKETAPNTSNPWMPHFTRDWLCASHRFLMEDMNINPVRILNPSWWLPFERSKWELPQIGGEQKKMFKTTTQNHIGFVVLKLSLLKYFSVISGILRDVNRK